jgi:hypothetical protein
MINNQIGVRHTYRSLTELVAVVTLFMTTLEKTGRSRQPFDSTVVVSKAVSSASIVDLVNMVCLHNLRDTSPPPKVNTYPLVALISSTSEIQFASLYPSSTEGCPE